MQEGEFGSMNPGLLGDVVISAATAAREAEDAGITFRWFFCCFTVYFISSAMIMSAPERPRQGVWRLKSPKFMKI